MQRVLCRFKAYRGVAPQDVRAFLRAACFASYNDDHRDPELDFQFVTLRDLGRASRGWEIRVWVTASQFDAAVRAGYELSVGRLRRTGRRWELPAFFLLATEDPQRRQQQLADAVW